jgi:cys/met metabolism PLP-dependent enzyme
MEDAASRAGVTPENVNYLAPKVLVWLESPTNPMLEVADLPALLSAARRLGIVTAVDNTFATPILQRPLDLGADVVVHSATKFLAGHSDVLLGMALTSNEELYKAMLHHRITNGAIPGPVEAWLGLRGLRTLALRVERAVQNAQVLAERLSEHPFVTEVRYPGLESDRGHEVAKKQMDGFGAILCVTLDTDASGARNVVEALKLWTPATSLGGVESLVERRRRHGNEPDSIPESLLRLSVGIENVDDLYNDLVEAFKVVR